MRVPRLCADGEALAQASEAKLGEINNFKFSSNSVDIKIRKAVLSDCARMMELIKELAIFEKAPDEVTVTMDHFMKTGFGENPVWKALVAVTEEEKIIGISLYYMRYSTWKGLRLYLEDLIVTEEFRGKGIGKLLFDRTIQEANELGVSGMMWQVLDWNERAIDFYKKYGADVSSEWLNCSLSLKPIVNC
jgi:GNAT superfamily N-acetyltransferase